MKGDIWIECDGREAQKMAYNDKHEPIWLTKYTPAKPKVRLEELCEKAEHVYSINGSKPKYQAIEATVRAICTHLGIELETKEEWERAYEEHRSEGLCKMHAGGGPEELYVMPKHHFKTGWLACEKARGK